MGLEICRMKINFKNKWSYSISDILVLPRRKENMSKFIFKKMMNYYIFLKGNYSHEQISKGNFLHRENKNKPHDGSTRT